jgi:uncharacterized membrane protein YdcZ (DUF606 family)
MILGTIPDLAIAATAFGIGRAYHKPWLAIVGGVLGAAVIIHAGLVIYAVNATVKAGREASA